MGFCRGKRYFETVMGFDGLCWLSVLGYVPAVGGVGTANERKYGAGGIGGVWEDNTLYTVSGGVPVLVRGMNLGSSPRTRMMGEGSVAGRRYRLRVRDHPIYSPAPMMTPAPINVAASGSCPKIMNPTPTDPSNWKYWNGAMMLAGARASARTTQ